jgi:phage gp46-like protein
LGDLTLVWDNVNQHADWQVGVGDLVSGNTLQTAVIRSLFTDKRAPAGTTLPYPSADLRGCWSDSYTGIQIGSLLWLLERTAIGDRTTLLLQAETYASDALAWLITEGVAATINVTATFAGPDTIALSIELVEPSGAVNQFQFAWVWAGG